MSTTTGHSLFELWAIAFRHAYRAFEGGVIGVNLLKQIISRLRPILDKTIIVETELLGIVQLLVTPLSKCLASCSRRSSDGSSTALLGRPGPEGIADEVESVWTKVVDRMLNYASMKDVEVLSPLLVSALSSSNTKILNMAVECWNTKFGNGMTDSELPAKLRYCLKKLSKRVEISIPKNKNSVK